MNMKTRPSLHEIENSEAVTTLSQPEDRGVCDVTAPPDGDK